MTKDFAKIEDLLERIAAALERRGAPPVDGVETALKGSDAFVWEAEAAQLVPVAQVAALPLELLKGIDAARDTLLENTRRFADGLARQQRAALGRARHGQELAGQSGARGSEPGARDSRGPGGRLALIEIHREDIGSLPLLLRRLRGLERRFLLFCDDLSFDRDDTSYKSLKAALEGGVEGRPANVLFYATSNRRHMMPRDMMENERSTAINPSEAVEEKVSLSDRFGLWLGFHHCGQDEYLAMVEAYAAHFKLPLAPNDLHRARAGLGGGTRRAFGPRRLAIHSGPAGAGQTGSLGKALDQFATR